MQYRIKSLLILTTLIGFVLAGIVFVIGATQSRVIASAEHPNGARFRVIQSFNYSPELFTTSIYFDDGDGKWRWYYFDHEDFYWGNASAEIVENKFIVVSRSRRIELDTITGECTTTHSGRTRKIGKSDRVEAFSLLLDEKKTTYTNHVN